MARHALLLTDLRTRAVLTLHGLMVACVVRPSGGDDAGSTSSTAEVTSTSTTIGSPTTTGAPTGSLPSGTTQIGGGTSTTTDTGSTFLVSPDMGGAVECDPFAEMPCPEGQKCSAASRRSRASTRRV